GRLPRDVTQREIEKLVREFGRIRDIRILTGFCFVEFDDARDARYCVRELDGVRYDGDRLLVQPARTEGNRRRDPTELRHGEFRVKVTGLPPRTSWQDLKDLMRKSCDVIFADVDGTTGDGVVEFTRAEDKETAIRQFDGYDYQGSIITVTDPLAGDSNGSGANGHRDERRSPSPRGRSASPPRGREERRSPSPRGGAHSRSRSRSRSPRD
ncbi:hypothetical protein BC831DRAFT_545642, partial [Entophlyctis helioformis]